MDRNLQQSRTRESTAQPVRAGLAVVAAVPRSIADFVVMVSRHLKLLCMPNRRTFGSIDRDTSWEQQTKGGNLGSNLELRHLPQCYKMAHEFWTDVLRDARISAEFKEHVAARHIRILEELNPGIEQ